MVCMSGWVCDGCLVYFIVGQLCVCFGDVIIMKVIEVVLYYFIVDVGVLIYCCICVGDVYIVGQLGCVVGLGMFGVGLLVSVVKFGGCR